MKCKDKKLSLMYIFIVQVLYLMLTKEKINIILVNLMSQMWLKSLTACLTLLWVFSKKHNADILETVSNSAAIFMLTEDYM